ncbi:MAG: 50S ribosomal protein L6 [Candidatus Dadabacteria bacterium]|nr:MAG: 50S ribosomal protein L6 [Candidatus Dadabacteria bacterium]
MSRIGKLPVEIPSGVQASVDKGVVSVQGPKGKLEYHLKPNIEVSLVDNTLVVKPRGSDKQTRADYGTTRAHLNNMVLGVTRGWQRKLELNGVGFNAQQKGQELVLSVGFSHDVTLRIPENVTCKVGKGTIELESCSKEAVGQFAARIRKVQPPEPYLGKGIKYAEETIRRKAGKTGK